MSLHTLHPERVDEARTQAYSTFAPLLMNALAQKLARSHGSRNWTSSNGL